MAGESTRWAAIGWDSPSIRQSIWRVMATDVADVVEAISAASS